MNVASLELCKELHQVSGWKGTAWSWYCDEGADDDPVMNLSEPLKVAGGVGYFDHQYPAYDLGYLLRKLQDVEVQMMHLDDRWHCWPYGKYGRYLQVNVNPEDAVASLAIALLKDGKIQPNKIDDRQG